MRQGIRRLLLLVVMTGGSIASAAPIKWPPYLSGPPGGFATVSLISPQHGERVQGPKFVVRVQSDNPRAVVHVLLDDKIVAPDGGPMKNQPANLHEVLPITFYESTVVEIPVRGLASGVHTVEIKAASRGSSLPLMNHTQIEFLVR